MREELKDVGLGYEFKKGKYVFCKDGVYFALNINQIRRMRTLCRQIITIENREPDTRTNDKE